MPIESSSTSTSKWRRHVEHPEPVHLIGETGEPAFDNNWVNYGSGYEVCGFYKHLDRVYLQGLIKSGTVNTGSTGTAFTLPAGYRPVGVALFDVQSNFALGRIDVRDSGQVRMHTGGNAWFSLDGLSFRVA